MLNIRKYLLISTIYFAVSLLSLVSLHLKINSIYSDDSLCFQTRKVLIEKVYLASPALAPAGRNIAFETSNAVSNATASYLTMLDCCESDEAIADRIALGKTQCRIIRRAKNDY